MGVVQELFSDFMLVTTQEVEFYTVVPSIAPQKAPVKSVTHATAFHWFLVRWAVWWGCYILLWCANYFLFLFLSCAIWTACTYSFP